MEQTETFAQIKRKTLISTLSLFFSKRVLCFFGFGGKSCRNHSSYSKNIWHVYYYSFPYLRTQLFFGYRACRIFGTKKEVSDDDVKTTFTVQQCMIIVAISVGFLVTNFVKGFYKLPTEGVYLYWALLISFFISSLKTIPSIFLERKIKFQRIVLVQVIENTVFYLSVIIFAILKFELWSFTIAVLLRAITGLILIYILSHHGVQPSAYQKKV